jgi:cell division protein FtsL
MISFGITLSVLFLFVMVYLWQHFSAIEYGYRIEQLTVQRNAITESNRALSLEEASLKDPARIDRLAKQIGMQRPAGGQLQPMDSAIADPSTPVMAQANGITVISAQP